MSFNEYQIHEISLGKMNDRLPCNIECLDYKKYSHEWNCITKDKHIGFIIQVHFYLKLSLPILHRILIFEHKE